MRGARITKYYILIGLYVTCLALVGPELKAGEPEDTNEVALEYEIKATFMCKFAKFVTWPPEVFSTPGSPIRIGILGQDPFGLVIDKIANRMVVKNRKFVVERCTGESDFGDYHMLFVSRSEENQLKNILSKLSQFPILTISEMDGFYEHGGIINFIITGSRVRFEINADAAKSSGLEISTGLLRIAKIVQSSTGHTKELSTFNE